MYGMKVCVVTGAADRLPECDVALFGFERLGDVDYGDELSGKSEKLEEAARLSRTHGCCAVCGCTTYSRGAVRRSAAVAERGKLLGICDMTRVFGGEKYKSGADMGLFFTRGGRVGVCIENDIYFPECKGVRLPVRRARSDVRRQDGVFCLFRRLPRHVHAPRYAV